MLASECLRVRSHPCPTRRASTPTPRSVPTRGCQRKAHTITCRGLHPKGNAPREMETSERHEIKRPA